MALRDGLAKGGKWLAIGGALAGYACSRFYLQSVECVEGAYSLSCESLADRLLFALGNFGSVLTAFIFSIPGLAIWALSTRGEDDPSP